jgi:hypothetical protein
MGKNVHCSSPEGYSIRLKELPYEDRLAIWRSPDPFLEALARAGGGVRIPAAARRNNLAFLALLECTADVLQRDDDARARLPALLREYDPDGVLLALADPLNEALVAALGALLAPGSRMPAAARAAAAAKVEAMPAYLAFARASNASIVRHRLGGGIHAYSSACDANAVWGFEAGAVEVPADLRVFRGVDPGPQGRGALRARRGARGHDTLVFDSPGFFPTSTSVIVSLGAAANVQNSPGGTGPPISCLTQMLLPKFSRALYIHDFNSAGGQREVLVFEPSYTSTPAVAAAAAAAAPPLFWGRQRVLLETGHVVPSTQQKQKKRAAEVAPLIPKLEMAWINRLPREYRHDAIRSALQRHRDLSKRFEAWHTDPALLEDYERMRRTRRRTSDRPAVPQ